MNGPRLRILQLALFLLTGIALAPSVSAQQANPETGFVAPRPKKTEVESTTIEKPTRYDISGIVAQAFNIKKPYQMVNPLAPAKYGDGRDNVSWDPDKPEKPKGIILFGIQW